mmetsp:Transcript_7722/g.11100  ORF Transcript_7722/g.11100 Transcript_7722/m.11100 type:complete len:255 (+) Transcript_7722:134-898(+)
MTGTPERQCVWIVRYGLTKFPLVESLGPFDSPIDPTEGIEHAKSIAKRIAQNKDDAPKHIYSSPFLRTAQTAQLVALEMSPSCKVCIEDGLWEWLTPSLLVEPNGVKTEPKSAVDLSHAYGTIDTAYESVNPIAPDGATDVPEGAPHFPEDEKALFKRCATTISRLLDASNGESMAIVSHAPCDQAMAFYLEGAASPAESKLTPWPLGGITMFARTKDENGDLGPWVMELYGDTEHMPGKYKPGIKEWSLPCLA